MYKLSGGTDVRQWRAMSAVPDRIHILGRFTCMFVLSGRSNFIVSRCVHIMPGGNDF